MLAGLAYGVASALIGGLWQVVTRQSTTTTIDAPDLVVLRYLLPALLLAPIAWRTGLRPAGVPTRVLVALVAGAGLPFGLLAMTGTRYAPSSHMGVLVAGTAPLFTAAFAWLLWRERPDAMRAAGFALTALGVLTLGAASIVASATEAWRGDLLFVAAALAWAVFTVAFRASGLGPWQAAALVNTGSALLLLPMLAARGGGALLDAPPLDLLWQAAWQGAIAGVLGLWTFAQAIARLGATRAAAFGALAPVVSALAGWLWLGDRLGALEGIAIAAASAGVLLASGALQRGPE